MTGSYFAGHSSSDLLLPYGVCSAGQVLTYLATGAPTCVTNGSGTGIGCSGSCSTGNWAQFTDSTHITNVAAPTYVSVGADAAGAAAAAVNAAIPSGTVGGLTYLSGAHTLATTAPASQTPTANAVVQADTFGTLNPWVGGRTVDSWQDKNGGNISTSGSAWLQVTSTHSFSVPIYGGGTGYYGGTIMCTGSVTSLPNSSGGLNLAIDLDGGIVATAAQTTIVASYLNLSAVAYNSYAASGSHTVDMWIQSSNGSTVFSVDSSSDPWQSASLNCQLISH